MQRLLGVTKAQYNQLFGESFTALAPLFAVCGAGGVICATYMGRIMWSHPDVYVSQGQRTSVIRDNQSPASTHLNHWVRTGSAANLAQNEFHTHVFSGFNRSAAGGARPRLDMEKVDNV
jgi:hypothetical protein